MVVDISGYEVTGLKGNLYVLYQPTSGPPGVCQSLAQCDVDQVDSLFSTFLFVGALSGAGVI